MRRKLTAILLAIMFRGAGVNAADHTTAGQGQVRTYFIAADNVEWNYEPMRLPLLLRAEREVIVPPEVHLKVYKKAIYREYTDATFQTLKVRPPEWEHLGMLGPLIRAEVDDTVKVVFRNNSPGSHIASEGTYYIKRRPPSESEGRRRLVVGKAMRVHREVEIGTESQLFQASSQ